MLSADCQPLATKTRKGFEVRSARTPRLVPVLLVPVLALAACGASGASSAGTAASTLDSRVVPATCEPAPAGKKPPQPFLLASYHAELQTRAYGDVTFDAGTVTAVTGTSITIARTGDGKVLTFTVPDAASYKCGSSAASITGQKASVVSRGTTAVTIWPWTTQTPEIFKLAYHAVYAVAHGNGNRSTRIVDEGYVWDWAGQVPGSLTYRRGDGTYITVEVKTSTSAGNASGHIKPASWQRCDLVQVITGGKQNHYLKVRVNNPATHPDGNPYQRIAAGGACK